jgi:hypothetical protein
VTLIRTVVLYGCQSWAITNTDERNLTISERKILRKICGPSSVNEVWRIKKRLTVKLK